MFSVLRKIRYQITSGNIPCHFDQYDEGNLGFFLDEEVEKRAIGTVFGHKAEVKGMSFGAGTCDGSDEVYHVRVVSYKPY